ncbi:putative Calcium-binding EF-hand family protein [Tripterygium wilfordii]|uniref:Putative Calcium-binding EF-hand family protein n=1 Tax=Tripterygium wilfordii TaxID=458696 RepID=A0A7J7DL82_TRIWF|nr:putative Calcium-binding EF-hand family protein [Tripterygium wilfordii]
MPLYMAKCASVNLTEGQLKTIFKEHDINGDGEISKEELKKAFQKLGSWFSDWRVRGALQHADTNGDGSISIGEIDDLIKYAIKFGYNTKSSSRSSK